MRYLLIYIFIFSNLLSFANKGAGEIYTDLQKLHSLKKVLYIAAHPDDENTRALAWFSLGEKAETAYLSLTRGDGGQNLIGNELSEDLGVLRTQELLAARSYDGAKQFFTRAVDFGYSKSAKESFEKWGKAELLSDVVLIIRQFKPDVIITRFPPDERAGHGHHTASAMLAIEAFEKAADPNFLPSQVAKFGVWKTTSLYWNASSWWDKDIGERAKGNDQYMVADIGGYNSFLGMSYNEIGTLARSQHKCQGFGAILERGSRIEYFEHMEGLRLQNSFFEKNIESWTKKVNQAFENKFNNLLSEFNFLDLTKNVPVLLELKKELEQMPPSLFAKNKIKLCQEIIINCLGLYLEVLGEDYAFVSNQKLKLSFNLINRSSNQVKLETLHFDNGDKKSISKNLPLNEVVTETIELIPVKSLSNSYWLVMPFKNLFTVVDPQNLGKAEGEPILTQTVDLSVNGEMLRVTLPVVYKWREPSYGERQRDLISAPKYAANFDQKLVILKPNQEKTIKVKVHAFQENINENLLITVPKGWTVSPKIIELNLKKKHEETWVEFKLTPTDLAAQGEIELKDQSGTSLFSYSEIVYDHIPTQVKFKTAAIKCIKLDAAIKKGKVVYIKGVEDAVPQAIEQLGFDVKVIEVSDLSSFDLSSYQSVVLGIRIYNVHPELKNFETKLFSYVKNGGNVVMQYNTASRSLRDTKMGPVPFELSRNRVTEEDSEVEFLAPNHPILNSPNKITQADFKDWVQERGLYFANNWDAAYTPILSWHDIDEAPVNGALIVTKYGKGQFIYTGISFFRELPNGVVGAYRLFANILSYQPAA